jgi:16S rRNA (guanine527-N7)-methyltransferase
MSSPTKTLTDVLSAAQKLGTLGGRPISEVISHAEQFLPPLAAVHSPVIDIGTGAGVPGLIIAQARPDLSLVLADRRATRMDALTRGVLAMGLADRVQVLTVDIEDLGRDPEHARHYGAVVCRGFGPPEVTLNLATPLVKDGGIIVVSEPPEGTPTRWAPELLQKLGLTLDTSFPGVAMFHVKHSS